MKKLIKRIFKKKLKTICDRCTVNYHYPDELENGLCKACFIEMAKNKYDKKHKK